MPVPPKKLTPKGARMTLRDFARTHLKEAILDGTFAPGEVFHDQATQEWLGVSRTPLRDAFLDLERIGLIETEPNRYTRVALPEPDELIDALHTLGVLLGGAARLAVPRMDENARTETARSIERAVIGLREGDLAAVNQATVEFFAQIVAHCGNPFLERLCVDALDGLAYKLRIAETAEVLSFEMLIPRYEATKAAVLRGSGVETESAITALHLLPES